MRYLIDTNSLSDKVLKGSLVRDDLYVLQDVVDEYVFSEQDLNRIKMSKITVVEIGRKHLEKLKDILKDEGDNLELIRMYTNEGTGDVIMLAYAVAEKEKPETLFSDKYTIITKDKGLIKVAKKYGISCQNNLK